MSNKKSKSKDEDADYEISENTDLNIYQRLHAVMSEVKYIQKDMDVKITSSSSYKAVSHDAVTKKCRAALVKHRVVATSSVIEHSREWVTSKNKWDKEVTSLFTTVKLETRFVNIDDPTDFMAVTSYGYGLDTQDKGIGKAISYAAKYNLLKALLLETGDNPENDNDDAAPIPKDPKSATPKPTLVRKMSAEERYDFLKEKLYTFKDKESFAAHWKGESFQKDLAELSKADDLLFQDICAIKNLLIENFKGDNGSVRQ